MQKEVSRKIYYYSFFLSLLVMLVHAVNLAENNLLLAEKARGMALLSPVGLENLFSNTLGQAAVPGFFFLSGMLFYRNLWSMRGILSKWRSRISSLLLPYCFWNALWYLLYVLLGRAALTAEDAVRGIFLYAYHPVFWYLFQLLLLTALAPLIYLLLKKRAVSLLWVPIWMLVLLWQIDIPYLNEDAFFYYYMGALLGRDPGSRGLFLGERGKRPGRGFALGALVCVLLLLMGGEWWTASRALPGGAVVLWTVLRRLLMAAGFWLMLPGAHLPEAPRYMRMNFFLYAIHYPLIRIVYHLTYFLGIRGTDSLQETILLVSYFLLPLFVVGGAVIARRVLRRMPVLWRVMNGGR